MMNKYCKELNKLKLLMDNNWMLYNNHSMKMAEEAEDMKKCYNKLLKDFVKDIMGKYQMLKVSTNHDYNDRSYDMVNPWV